MRRDTSSDAAGLIEVAGPPPWPLALVRRAGWTDKQIRGAVDAGRLVRPSRGVLSVPLRDATPRQRTVDAARAALLSGSAGSVVSHETAAVLHGLWLPARHSRLVHLTAPGAWRRTQHGVRTHDFPLGPDDGSPGDARTTLSGIPVTSLERTAVDVARGQPLAQALVVLDSAARARVELDVVGGAARLRDPRGRDALVARVRDGFRPHLDPCRGHPGTRVVRLALDLLDPCSESPFESASRAVLLRSGLPRPVLAWPLRGASGRLYFGDFAWLPQRLVGEADGWSKYGEGHDVRAALAAERRRQRDLEDAGWRFVRWDPSDRPAELRRRVGTALTAPR